MMSRRSILLVNYLSKNNHFHLLVKCVNCCLVERGDPRKHFADWTGALMRSALAKIRECRKHEVMERACRKATWFVLLSVCMCCL